MVTKYVRRHHTPKSQRRADKKLAAPVDKGARVGRYKRQVNCYGDSTPTTPWAAALIFIKVKKLKPKAGVTIGELRKVVEESFQSLAGQPRALTIASGWKNIRD